jgi:hypothetical protein
VRLKGRWSRAGWSKTVSDGVFRIVDGAIIGSTLVADLTTGSDAAVEYRFFVRG